MQIFEPMEFSIGRQALESGASALNSELSKVNYKQIRKYFDISSSYVLEKLALIVFPFGQEDSMLYRPDLYIPVMSLVTLVLFKGLLLGLSNRFHPEVLGMSFSRTVFIHIGQSLLYKGAAYFLDAPLDFSDMVCFSGYKFVCVLLIKLVGMLYFGKVMALYFYVSYFFFLSRTLKKSFIRGSSPRLHLYLLFAIVIVDLFTIFFFSK